MDKIGFGLIGTGGVAAVHAEALCHSDCAYLAAVCGSTPEKSAAFAERCKVKAVSLDEMLAMPEIQAVCVATPSGYHLEPVSAAARAGKHIMCEKPLEINLERVDSMIRVCRENKVLLSSFFQRRQLGAVSAVRQAIDRGRFGKLVYVSAKQHWFRGPEYYQNSAWRGTWKLDGGGALMNQGSHIVDLLLYLGGPVKSLSAATATVFHDIEVEDSASVRFEYCSGAMGAFEVSTACKPGFAEIIEIAGTAGNAVLEGDVLTRWIFDKEEPEDENIRKLFAPGTGNAVGAASALGLDHRGHMKHIDNLVRAIQNGEKLLLPPDEGRAVVAFICGAYESAARGGAAVMLEK